MWLLGWGFGVLGGCLGFEWGEGVGAHVWAFGQEL